MFSDQTPGRRRPEYLEPVPCELIDDLKDALQRTVAQERLSAAAPLIRSLTDGDARFRWEAEDLVLDEVATLRATVDRLTESNRQLSNLSNALAQTLT